MLTVLVCITSVVAAVCGAIRMEAVWLSAPPTAAQRAVPPVPARAEEAVAGGRPG